MTNTTVFFFYQNFNGDNITTATTAMTMATTSVAITATATATAKSTYQYVLSLQPYIGRINPIIYHYHKPRKLKVTRYIYKL